MAAYHRQQLSHDRRPAATASRPADFDSKGYRLIGGRTDLLDQQRAAVLVYQHGAHVINVFAWANDRIAMPHETLRNGFHLAFWSEGNLTYCAVSDAEWDAVLELKRLLQGLSVANTLVPRE